MELNIATVLLSKVFKGSQCNLDGYVISGNGAVLADVALHQDRVYWEVTVVDFPEGAEFVLGVARK